MGKLSRIKGWMTVKDAASSLSKLIGEQVEESDIYQLAMREEMMLSVLFIGDCYAKQGRIVDETEVTSEEFPSLHNPALKVKAYDAIRVSEDTWIRLDEDIVRLSGIYYLPMIGGEAIEIESRYHFLTEGLFVEMVNLDGVYVCNSDKSIYFKLYEQEDEVTPKNYYQLGSLPKDLSIVVTTTELEAVAKKLNEPVASAPKELSGKSETSYQNIIGAMLKLLEKENAKYSVRKTVINSIIGVGDGRIGTSESHLSRTIPNCERIFDSR